MARSGGVYVSVLPLGHVTLRPPIELRTTHCFPFRAYVVSTPAMDDVDVAVMQTLPFELVAVSVPVPVATTKTVVVRAPFSQHVVAVDWLRSSESRLSLVHAP